MSIGYVVYNLLNSYSQACTTFVGQDSGARNYRRCKNVLAVSLVEGMITAVLLIVAVSSTNPTFRTVMAIYPISLGANAAVLLELLILRPARM